MSRDANTDLGPNIRAGVPAITEGIPAVTSGVPAITAGVSPSRTDYTIVFVSLLLVSSSFRNSSSVRKSSEFFLHKGKKKYPSAFHPRSCLKPATAFERKTNQLKTIFITATFRSKTLSSAHFVATQYFSFMRALFILSFIYTIHHSSSRTDPAAQLQTKLWNPWK